MFIVHIQLKVYIHIGLVFNRLNTTYLYMIKSIFI